MGDEYPRVGVTFEKTSLPLATHMRLTEKAGQSGEDKAAGSVLMTTWISEKMRSHPWGLASPPVPKIVSFTELMIGGQRTSYRKRKQYVGLSSVLKDLL